MRPVLMTAEDISQEIYGGNINARSILERISFQKGYPKAIQEGKRSKKFWRRCEIYAYYKAEPIAA